ncbi:MAG: hypothetical protein ABR498_04045 [Candidatus Dormibacteria bacterium]
MGEGTFRQAIVLLGLDGDKMMRFRRVTLALWCATVVIAVVDAIAGG